MKEENKNELGTSKGKTILPYLFLVVSQTLTEI